ncbi:MAG TPA: NAD+ synthase, partial [Rhodospirillaceae bacterium]|nr:NAD+ synthase [Rhodospirillaceae bacterium]
NYGVFDEKRLFKSDDSTAKCFDYIDKRIGIEICEDLWSTVRTKQLKADGAELLIVINGSPFTVNKQEIRYELTQDTGLPVIYVNQCGGQDDLVFDGASFVTNTEGEITHRLKDFAPDSLTIDLHKDSAPISIPQGEHYHLIYEALKCGLRDYVHKNGFKGVLIGLSGGIDSALSAIIAADALGPENVHTVMLPSPFTSNDSHEDAKTLAENLGIKYDIVPIAPMMETMERSLTGLNGLAHENMQSRARGLILMTLSNQKELMVLTTGNKSEMACGYATLYGDMCGGYNVLKDLYKTEVYALSRWINDNTPHEMPERIITKVPTAELRENQTDQDNLPPYEILDDILEHLIEFDEGFEEIEARGHDRETIEKVWTLLDIAEYKRRQSAPGVKITSRAFGRDRRYPITNKFKGHI